MNIFVATDHGGFHLKNQLKPYLEKMGYTVIDCGPERYKPQDDYPDYIIPLARKVAQTKTKGIIACRNGQGVCIAANKVKGIRAVTGFSRKEVKTTRQDDNANILCLPADYLSTTEAKRLVKIFLVTPFSNATRHKRRLAKIRRIEQ